MASIYLAFCRALENRKCKPGSTTIQETRSERRGRNNLIAHLILLSGHQKVCPSQKSWGNSSVKLGSNLDSGASLVLFHAENFQQTRRQGRVSRQQ